MDGGVKGKSIVSRRGVLGVLVCVLLAGSVTETLAGEANLVGWWKFDEGSGTTAENSGSFGSSHNGVLHYMTPSDWVGGVTGTALDFDGINDYVSIPALNLDSDTVTISAWIKRKGDQSGSDTGIVFSRDGSTVAGLSFGHEEGWIANHHLGYNWNDVQAAWDWDSRLFIPDGEWVFVAVAVEPTKATLYVGEDEALSLATHVLDHDIEAFDGVTFIASDGRWYGRFFKGRIDDVRIYNRALSAEEILQLYGECFGGRAFNPDPADRAECVRPDAVLNWMSGKDTTSHDVYFGTDRDVVKDATTSSSEYKGNQEQSSYEANGLKFGKTYYWRIDEVNESDVNSPWEGDVWSFTTNLMAADQGEAIILSSAEKICQLVGDWDRERGEPTINLTDHLYNLPGTDLGAPFRHKDRTYIVFGDVFYRDDDPIACTTDTSPEDCLELTFLHNGPDPDGYGSYRSIQIPGVSLGAYEVPMEGVSIDGSMYIYATTDHSWPVTMGRSVVAVSDDDGYNFEYLYDLSAEYFINVSIVETELSNSDGLPGSEGVGLVMFGSGTYRESNVRLAFQPAEEIESATSILYFSGFGDNGEPVWSSNESDAIELFNQPCVGELSVTYNQFIKKWIMLYNCCCHALQRGINVRTADNPWGPWSEYRVIFEPWDDGGYCHFIHTNWDFRRCDSVHDPGRKYEWGGEYGPYQFEDLAVGDCSTTTIYFTMSTWNPYTVVLMSAMLGRVTEEPPVITLNGSAIVVLECGMDSYTEEGATGANLCEPDVPVVIGGDTVDTSTCGTYVVTYNATDDSGNSAAQVTRTVVVEDTTPPEFSLFVEPNVLWPPNHRMVRIEVSWEVSDDCDEEGEVSLVGVTSSEEDDGRGDGRTKNDIVIADDGSIYLRAERTGSSAGRVYTITYEAVDDSGNASVGSAEVLVPDGYRWRHRERIRPKTLNTRRKTIDTRRKSSKRVDE